MTADHSGTREHNAATSIGWVVKLRAIHAELLGSLRPFRGVQILETETGFELQEQTMSGFLWLRIDLNEAETFRRIRFIPDVELFTIRSDEQITRENETVPCALMPQGEWIALDEWIELELPRAGFQANVGEGVILKLVRSSSPTSTNVLQTNWKTWSEYATTAPQVRLNRLAFAVSGQSSVLIRGTPIPPIHGRRCSESNGIIVPNGWRFDPNVGTAVVRQLLELNDSELALFSDDGSFERLTESAFVQATRSAIRMTHG